MRSALLRSVIVVSLTIAIAGAVAQPASATVAVLEHFRTFFVSNGPSLNALVTLRDQFGQTATLVSRIDQVGVPTQKNDEPFEDTRSHLTFWTIEADAPPVSSVVVRNQFGEAGLEIGNPAYLLAPALKNGTPTEPLPNAINHFKCYQAIGQSVGISPALAHQFGTEVVDVLDPRLLCNPAEKILPDGTTYPIVDEFTHLVCYKVIPPAHANASVVIRDQFVEAHLELTEGLLLCVPSEKTGVVQVDDATWGQLKSIYR